MNWRLVHVWLRGYSDAEVSANRAHCYTSEAKDAYNRGFVTRVNRG